MPNKNIMSDDEIHEFGINIVLEDLRKNGFIISAVTYEKRSNPQIIAERNGQKYHILVRTACYPYKGNIESREFGYKLLEEARNNNANCYIACIGIANADGTTDLEKAIPIRDAGYYIAYNGLESLTLEKVISSTSTSKSTLYNRDGETAGSVIRGTDGRHTIVLGEKADVNAVLMSTCLAFASIFEENAFSEQRILFSKWAHLPQDTWTPTHQRELALALMHFIMEARINGRNLPMNIQVALKAIPPQVLPELKNPLTEEIRTLFSSIFSG